MGDDHSSEVGDSASREVALRGREAGGLTVVDPVERRRYDLATPAPLEPEPADTAVFRFPVDAAVRVTADRLELPEVLLTFVRDADGRAVAEIAGPADASFTDGPYEVELTPPIKCYLRVPESFSLHSDGDRMVFSFPPATELLVGARSHHDRPAATITTTEAPEDLLAAVSAFGSALKTTSPERSFPTLRGHPPRVELGDELHVPDGLAAPTPEVRIEVPPALEYCYPIAPLAYYLGAAVEVGDEPRIVGPGLRHELGVGVDASARGHEPTARMEARGDGDVEAFQRDVRRTLEQVFVLDCVTRTEGLYPIELHERRAIETVVDLDFAALYDAEQSRRLDAYLSVPYQAVEPHVPEWTMTAGVEPAPEHATTLPYLVDDLCAIETRQSTPVEPAAVEHGALHGMVRGECTSDSPSYVRVDVEGSAAARTWVGDGMPVDAGKALERAYRNRIGRVPAAGDIEIAVVCNDSHMGAERDAVDRTYGDRTDRSFAVDVHRDLSSAAFAEVLADDYDLLHYVGHIEDGGVRCADGLLDVGTLEAVGVDAFVLNACRSYDQGVALVDGGAIGGIVTLSDVVDVGAVRIGRDVARLLNCGFPLHAALDVARDASVVGAEYTVVGDGSLTVTQCESGVPLLHDVARRGDGAELTYRTFTPGGVGGVHRPLLHGNDVHYLAGGESGSFELPWDELHELLRGAESPVRFEGELYTTAAFLERRE